MKRKILSTFLNSVLAIELASCTSLQGVPALFDQPAPSATVDILSSDYMMGCKTLNATSLEEQVGFRGVYIGRTYKTNVIKIFGAPISMSTDINGVETLVYDGFQVALKNQVTVSINDNSQQYILKNAILEYGCPDLILTGLNPENLPITMVVYLKLGIFMDTFESPLTLQSDLYLTYFEPNTLEQFLSSGFVKYISDIRVVSWDEAVK